MAARSSCCAPKATLAGIVSTGRAAPPPLPPNVTDVVVPGTLLLLWVMLIVAV